ncbi:hypothetical protein D7Z26_16390 [Cohnella endophytica]|uniref:Uncharacterized protein n=1 Tax=Cohnella endophytica TaxID=2419778 RepID=A0A494XRA7_9BACL|nr:hypothetical protein [Cohnella endophytica]RKP51376.1 hypothetical protein D7Z26_16390 [Cohnella endophytica]
MSDQRLYARIFTGIYALAIVVTMALVLLVGLPFARAGHTWLSLGALIFAESILYGATLQYISNSSRSRSMIPGYFGLITVGGIYFLVVVAWILLFSVGLNVSTLCYGFIHLVTLGIFGIVLGLMMLYFRNAEKQEDYSSSGAGY